MLKKMLMIGAGILLWLAIGVTGSAPNLHPALAAPLESTPSTTPTPNCSLAWRIVDTPYDPNNPSNTLTAVAAIATNDVWAVGGYSLDHSTVLTEHWNGTSWNFVAAPGPHSGLNGLAALASNDVWAVGTNYDVNATLVEHWDGSQWSIVASPNPGNDSELRGVAAISATDIWAVGSQTIITGGHGVAQTLTEHWDGQSWSVIPSPSVNPPSDYLPNYLIAVAAITINNVWTIGYYEDATTGFATSLIEHWDGVSWQVVSSPPIAFRNRLTAISAKGANDVWASGDQGNNGDGILVEHWDGTSWQQVPVSYPGTITDGFRGIFDLGLNNVWAVGDYITQGQPNRTLVEHWDGKHWTVVPSPSDNHMDILYAISAVSATDLWAVGTRYPVDPGTIALHYSVLDGCTTPTPISTPTASATPTFTPPPSVSATPSASATPTFTPAPGATDTATSSPTATATNPPTASITPTPQSRPTVIPSPAASATPCSQSYADVPTEYWAYGYIRYLSCRAIVSGYPDGLFRPDNSISRAEFSKMLALGYGLPLLTPAQPSFADVPPDYWAYTYIESLHAAGAISGYPDGGFHPSTSINRAELVKMNVLASGVPAYRGPLADYPDVPPGYWAYGYIKTATHQQWVGGYPDGRFRPTSDASRAELSKVLYLSLSYPRR